MFCRSSMLLPGLHAALFCLIGTGPLSAQRARQAASSVPPIHANVKYGPHVRNVMDVWLAKSDKPTPILISIHGGGFQKGDKSVDDVLRDGCLKAGISVFAITYRLSDTAIAPAQHMDAARAIQFIRSKAKEWNLDPKRMACTGGSAGAGISLWLAFHDDMADPKNADPILRESTRLTCAAVFNGQTSYDPRVIRDLFPGTDTYKPVALSKLFGVSLDNLDAVPPEKLKLFEQVSAINFLTKDDPPVLLCYNSKLDTPISSQSIGIHHPKFGMMLKGKMDTLGIECRVETGVGKGANLSPMTLGFIKKQFGMEKD